MACKLFFTPLLLLLVAILIRQPISSSIKKMFLKICNNSLSKKCQLTTMTILVFPKSYHKQQFFSPLFFTFKLIFCRVP